MNTPSRSSRRHESLRQALHAAALIPRQPTPYLKKLAFRAWRDPLLAALRQPKQLRLP